MYLRPPWVWCKVYWPVYTPLKHILYCIFDKFHHVLLIYYNNSHNTPFKHVAGVVVMLSAFLLAFLSITSDRLSFTRLKSGLSLSRRINILLNGYSFYSSSRLAFLFTCGSCVQTASTFKRPRLQCNTPDRPTQGALFDHIRAAWCRLNAADIRLGHAHRDSVGGLRMMGGPAASGWFMLSYLEMKMSVY